MKQKYEFFHNLLPLAARKILHEASQTPLAPEAPDPGLDRRIAVDRACAAVRRKWPRYFVG